MEHLLLLRKCQSLLKRLCFDQHFVLLLFQILAIYIFSLQTRLLGLQKVR